MKTMDIQNPQFYNTERSVNCAMGAQSKGPTVVLNRLNTSFLVENKEM